MKSGDLAATALLSFHEVILIHVLLITLKINRFQLYFEKTNKVCKCTILFIGQTAWHELIVKILSLSSACDEYNNKVVIKSRSEGLIALL